MDMQQDVIKETNDSALVLQYTDLEPEIVARTLIAENYDAVIQFSRYIHFALPETADDPTSTLATKTAMAQALYQRKQFKGQVEPVEWLLRLVWESRNPALEASETEPRPAIDLGKQQLRALLFLRYVRHLDMPGIAYVLGMKPQEARETFLAARNTLLNQIHPLPEVDHKNYAQLIDSALLGDISSNGQNALELHLGSCQNCMDYAAAVEDREQELRDFFATQAQLPQDISYDLTDIEDWVLAHHIEQTRKKLPGIPPEFAWLGLVMLLLLVGTGFFISFLDNGAAIPLFSSNEGRLGSLEANFTTNWEPVFSRDSAIYAISSADPALVDGDMNRFTDIFVFDSRQSEDQKPGRISIRRDGVEADGPSFQPAISEDGRFVVFASHAQNLEGDDVPICNSTIGVGYHCSNVFLYDRETNDLTLVSTPLNAGEGSTGDSFAPTISGDGTWIAFWSSSRNLTPDDEARCGNWLGQHNCLDVFLYDRGSGRLSRIEIGRSWVKQTGYYGLHLSRGGEWLLLTLRSNDGIAEFVTVNNRSDLYIFDRDRRDFEPVNKAADGTPGNGASYSAYLSEDGRMVVFTSRANNLVRVDNAAQNPGWNSSIQIYLRDRLENTVELVSTGIDGGAGDLNSGIYLANRFQLGEAAAVSRDGNLVLFSSRATNLTEDDLPWWCSSPPFGLGLCSNLYLFDRTTQSVTRVNGAAAPNVRYFYMQFTGEGDAHYVETSSDCIESCAVLRLIPSNQGASSTVTIP